jgi:hypothetical protein
MFRPALLSLLLSSVASAEVYKCTTEAGVTFTDTPCPGAEVITLPNTQGVGNLAGPSIAATADALQRDRLRAENRREIRERREKIVALRSQLNADLAAIERRKAHANNNLAGSVYLQSLSSEQEARATAAKSHMDAEQQALDRATARLEALR